MNYVTEILNIMTQIPFALLCPSNRPEYVFWAALLDIRASLQLIEDLLKSCWHTVVLMSRIMYKRVKWKGSPAVGWPSLLSLRGELHSQAFSSRLWCGCTAEARFCYKLKTRRELLFFFTGFSRFRRRLTVGSFFFVLKMYRDSQCVCFSYFFLMNIRF